MTSIESSPADLIKAAQAPGANGLYFIGQYTPRITFFSQQVRALRLARALDTFGYLKPNQKIGVVGAGAAGATVAVALALLGHKITLYDQSDDILHLQSESSRLLHPHIYEWPQLGSLEERAGLPILDWAAASGKQVVNSLRTAFNTLSASLPNLDFKKGHELTELKSSETEWMLSFKTGTVPKQRNLDHVFLTMGFGDELPCGSVKPEDYWKPGSVGTASTEAIKGTSYVVSGNGDGALTVILSLMLKGFEHSAFTREFLNLFKRDKVRAAVDLAFADKAFEEDVEGALRTNVLPILSRYGVIDAIEKKLRSDRIVTINTSGPLFSAGKASQLNQCMVLALLEAAEATSSELIVRSQGYVTGCVVIDGSVTLTGTAISGHPDTTSYKYAILRHGPDIKQRYQPAGVLIGQYQTHIKALIAADPQFGVPPTLDDETYNLFEAKRVELLEPPATRGWALANASQGHRIIEIAIDDATQVVAERGSRRISEIATACEQLTERYTVNLHVAPNEFSNATDLIRLARCSGGKIELRAGPTVLSAWHHLFPDMTQAPAPSSVRAIAEYDTTLVADGVDACLVRLLNQGIEAAISAGGAMPLGTISADILACVRTTWAGWQITLGSNPTLRFDFLRWLANVEQQTAQPWDGDRAAVQRMINALIMVAATHVGQPLAPCSNATGNLEFSANAVAIGSGCEAIGLQPLSSRSMPDDWGVDALILSAATDVFVSDSAGTVLDAGDTGASILSARRVRPAIIQNDQKWRARLGGPLVDWQRAVVAEFTEWRERQDTELQRVMR